MSSPQLLPDDFSGLVRLFPLPDLVMFPHVVQPLRVFEPRYVALLEDALQDDQLVTMALLQPGWEADYDGQPPIHSTVCVGRVISQSRQADGSYNLLLAGLARAQVRRELAMSQPFRRAEVAVLDEVIDTASAPTSGVWRERLLDAFWKLNAESFASNSTIQQLLRDQVSLTMLADVIAYAAPLRLLTKQQLLEEASVLRRVEILVDQLTRLSDKAVVDRPTSFPPGFSDN